MKPKEAIELLENLKVCKQAHILFNVEKEAVDLAITALKEETICPILSDDEVKQPCIKSPCGIERPHGEWEALGFQQGYAFCRCSNCHKTMRLYRDSKNEFCCIADIRKKVVSCMYCGADMRRKSGEQNDG